MSRFLLLFGAGSAIGFGLASCTCTRPSCTSSSECQSNEVCLFSGFCALRCTSNAQCLVTEKCSTSGGCVPRNGGCATTDDCESGATCQQGGTCSTPVGPTSTGGGRGAGGGGAPSGGGSGYGGGASAAGGGSQQTDAGQCGEDFKSISSESNLMIVLDGLKSMNDEIDAGVTMWKAAVAAVTQMTSGSASMHFGLEMFSVKATSSGEKECLSGSILVPIGDGNAAMITAALPSEAQGDGTPLAAGIKVALTDPALANPDRNNSLVVITDGSESCKGDPVAAVQEAFNRPVRVRTFVVGFGGSVKAATLEKMAVSGGTARLTTPRYYQADNPADLQAALTAISNSAQNCDFSLSQTPTDPLQAPHRRRRAVGVVRSEPCLWVVL